MYARDRREMPIHQGGECVSDMETALKYLREKEWSMGNGQCPECCGVPATWHGHPLHLTPETIGHKVGCELASAIRSAGGAPLMIGEFKSDVEFEPYITEKGFYSTRPKTVDGCPRIKKMNEEFDRMLLTILHGKISV